MALPGTSRSCVAPDSLLNSVSCLLFPTPPLPYSSAVITTVFMNASPILSDDAVGSSATAR